MYIIFARSKESESNAIRKTRGGEPNQSISMVNDKTKNNSVFSVGTTVGTSHQRTSSIAYNETHPAYKTSVVSYLSISEPNENSSNSSSDQGSHDLNFSLGKINPRLTNESYLSAAALRRNSELSRITEIEILEDGAEARLEDDTGPAGGREKNSNFEMNNIEISGFPEHSFNQKSMSSSRITNQNTQQTRKNKIKSWKTSLNVSKTIQKVSSNISKTISAKNLKASKEEKRAAVTLSLMIGSFTLCVIPAVTIMILELIDPPSTDLNLFNSKLYSIFFSLEFIFVVLLMGNALCNVLVYSLYLQEFRSDVGFLFREMFGSK